MITLSNGSTLRHVVACALAFDGRGYFLEPLRCWLGRTRWKLPRHFGCIRQELFEITLKSLTRHPRKGNLCWWKPWTWIPWSPWSCIRFLPGGAVNKVGLTNPGIDKWMKKIAPRIDFERLRIIVSIHGNEEESVYMASKLNGYNIIAVELNPACPNTGSRIQNTDDVISIAKAVHAVCRHPIIVKVSVAQDYVAIARGLLGIAEAMSFNSVPWEVHPTYKRKRSPLWRLAKRDKAGGGGISGVPAQALNWKAVSDVRREVPDMPVIAPGIMSHQDLEYARDTLRANAVSYCTIFLRRNPGLATKIVERENTAR